MILMIVIAKPSRVWTEVGYYTSADNMIVMLEGVRKDASVLLVNCGED